MLNRYTARYCLPRAARVARWRAFSASSSSPDDRSSFSSVWQAVDGNRHDGTRLVTPDPVKYLQGFDASAAVRPYRRAMLEAIPSGVVTARKWMHMGLKRAYQFRNRGPPNY